MDLSNMTPKDKGRYEVAMEVFSDFIADLKNFDIPEDFEDILYQLRRAEYKRGKSDGEKEYNKFRDKLKEWHNLIVKGLCNGLTHTHRDERNDNIDWVRKRLALFESFSRCVMNYEWGNNYKDFDEKDLKEVSKEGYSQSD